MKSGYSAYQQRNEAIREEFYAYSASTRLPYYVINAVLARKFSVSDYTIRAIVNQYEVYYFTN